MSLQKAEDNNEKIGHQYEPHRKSKGLSRGITNRTKLILKNKDTLAIPVKIILNNQHLIIGFLHLYINSFLVLVPTLYFR